MIVFPQTWLPACSLQPIPSVTAGPTVQNALMITPLPSTASGCTTAVACMNLKPGSTVANAAVPIAQSACSCADSGESDFVSNSPYYHALAVSIFLHEDASPALCW